MHRRVYTFKPNVRIQGDYLSFESFDSAVSAERRFRSSFDRLRRNGTCCRSIRTGLGGSKGPCVVIRFVVFP